MKYAPAYSILRVSFFTLAGVEGADLVGDKIVGRFARNLKLFSEREDRPFFEEFANWPSDREWVLRFTRRYGPLEQSARPNEEFRFDLRHWQFWQRSFREDWELLTPRPGVFPVSGSFEGTAGDRGWDWNRRDGLRYRAANLREYLKLSLWACPKNRLKKCARPECEHPYFVAHHLKQNYCSEECGRWAQQQWKRQWWRERGSEWRAAHRDKKRRASEKLSASRKREKKRRRT